MNLTYAPSFLRDLRGEKTLDRIDWNFLDNRVHILYNLKQMNNRQAEKLISNVATRYIMRIAFNWIVR